MKLAYVTKHGTFDVITSVITRDDKQYHNIRFGSLNPGLWQLIYGVNKEIADPEKEPNPIALTGDDYSLRPVLRDNKKVKDKQGNDVYFISKNKKPTIDDKNTLLAFIELPNYFYKNITFETTGDGIVIGVGHNGNVINSVSYSSPCIVMLIKGPIEINWKGFTKENDPIKQTISYTGDKWFYGDVKKY